MRRYRVQVTRPEIHFIDAETPAAAMEEGVVRCQTRVAPEYYISPTTRIEAVADIVDGKPV